MIETVAVDADGKHVGDLSAEDFRLTVDGNVTVVDAFDVNCSSLSAAEAAVMPPDRLVVVVDYYHLAMEDRTRVLESIQATLSDGLRPREEIMVAALAGGLRIEQRFTDDADEAVASLERMNYDSSLFARDLDHAKGEQYFEDLSTLMDVLAQYDGSKAVVLYSSVLARADVQAVWFEDVARRAASARAVFYPAYARWMQTSAPKAGLQQRPGSAAGVRILARLAVQTGGQVPADEGDLALSFKNAQSDMSCNYGVGYYMAADATLESHDLYLISTRPGIKLRFPAKVQFRSDDDKQEAMLRAAFADPQRFESPLVRAVAFPIRPQSRKSWESVLTLHFPAPSEIAGSHLRLAATLTRGGDVSVDWLEQRIDVPGSATENVPVTVLGIQTLDAAGYTFTVALSPPDSDQFAATRIHFEVPKAPKDPAFIRGPLLARVVPHGVWIKTDQGPTPLLDGVLAENESFAPLVVHDIGADEGLLAAWSACSGTKKIPAGAVVTRRIRAEDGSIVHELEAESFEPEGKKIPCQVRLDHLPAGTLEPGEYRFEIAVSQGGSKQALAFESAPLNVH
jgi:VWFA-related protein